MNSIDQNQSPCKTAPCPTLFKAQYKSSNQEIFFNTSQEAYEWILAHKNWVLKKQEVVNWSFPLERIVSKKCWIMV